MKDRRQVTPAEFQILEILWQTDRPLKVGEALGILQERRAVAYTTVMTLLDKLARKGSVVRKKKGKAYWYSPAVRRDEVLAFLAQEFADAYADGDKRRLADLFADGSRSPGRDRKSVRRPEPEKTSPQYAELDVALL